MRRRHESAAILLLVVPLLGLPACQPAGEEAEEAATAELAAGQLLGDLLADVEVPDSYEILATPPEPETPMTMLFKLENGEPVKVKMILDHGWLILDTRTNDTFVFEEEWGHIMKLPLAAAAEGVWADPRDYADATASVLGEEVLDGARCWIIESSSGPVPAKAWVGADDGLPRQVETEDGVTRFAYSRFGEVEESEFELPPQLRVVDLDEMIPGKG